ncbi:hypothetical protein L842_3242 [Mycobacterium intracellulare MIN_052511_1280]|nr:hypothetical protein L842_3242 [Mycobacterium intracellulare MIN_052511_1280]
MQPTHSAGMTRLGMIDLCDLAGAQQRFKFLGAEDAAEDSTGIAKRQGLHDLQIGQRGVKDVHVVAQSSPELPASAT